MGQHRSGRPQRCGAVTVVPLTSNTVEVHPFQTLVRAAESGLRLDSKAQAEQVRPVDVSRLIQRVGQLDQASRQRLDEALRIHLSL